jgi:predicted Zn-dependent protease
MTDHERQAVAMLAHLLLVHEQPARAATLLEALDALQPLESATLRALAVAQVRAGQPERALQALDQLAVAGPVDAWCHLLRSQALHALGRHVPAEQALRDYAEARHEALAGAAPTPAPQTAPPDRRALPFNLQSLFR